MTNPVYKAGDTLLLRVQVTDGFNGLIWSLGTGCLGYALPGNPDFVSASTYYREGLVAAIVEHIPAPWVPKVGDLVVSKNNPFVLGKILHIDEDGDWLFFHTSNNTKSVIRQVNHKYYELNQA